MLSENVRVLTLRCSFRCARCSAERFFPMSYVIHHETLTESAWAEFPSWKRWYVVRVTSVVLRIVTRLLFASRINAEQWQYNDPIRCHLHVSHIVNLAVSGEAS